MANTNGYVGFVFNLNYKQHKVLIRINTKDGYKFKLDGKEIDKNKAWEIAQDYIEWYQEEYAIDPNWFGFIAVRAQSTSGPFIIERARERNLGNSLAEWYGVFFSSKQARHIARLLNMVLEYEEV